MSELFLLDTDTVSYAFRGLESVVAKIREHSPSGLCISSISLAELRYGASVKRSKRIHRLIDAFISQVPVMPFDVVAANQFGSTSADLELSGQMIGEFDAMIAAHAIVLEATLVTNNLKHYQRIKGLNSLTWV
jgi:tRNA(fMet)-specific endonuclease VapC